MSTLNREAVRVAIPRQGGTHQAVLVLLHGDGVTGAGEAALIPGRDPAQALRSAEECAALDLEARRRGVPLAELLGGARRGSVECNALITGRRPEDVAARVDALAGEGFRAFKLKPVDGGGPLDLARLGAARFAGGRAARLRIDFGGALDESQAASVLRSLEQFELELVEQPLPAGAKLPAWQRLSGEGPIAADESLADPELGLELARAGIGLAIKLATTGGPSAALALAAAATGPVLLASSYETSIGLAAALHVACALEAEPLACGLATAGLLECDPGSGLELRAGRLALPAGPGLGVELDRQLLSRYAS